LQLPDIIIEWISSFVCNKYQQIAFHGYFSDWITVRGGMPQGSWLAPLVFLIRIDDLTPGMVTHKFMSVTTITEVIKKRQAKSSLLWTN